jgi:hypothetical protein
MSTPTTAVRPTELVLAALRCTSLRLKLIDNEIAMIGTALKQRLISPEAAIEWAEEVAPGCVDAIVHSSHEEAA